MAKTRRLLPVADHYHMHAISRELWASRKDLFEGLLFYYFSGMEIDNSRLASLIKDEAKLCVDDPQNAFLFGAAIVYEALDRQARWDFNKGVTFSDGAGI